MSDSEGALANNGLSPGKLLLQGRLQLGLTQEQVAKELYITLTKIKALESDDFGRLNTDTFIRGYIRAYANLLKLDVVEVLTAYEQLLQERSSQLPFNPEAKIEAPIAAQSNKGALQLLLVIGALFLGLWLISIWFFDDHPEKNYTAMAPVTSSYSSRDEGVSSESGSAGAQSGMVQANNSAALTQLPAALAASASSSSDAAQNRAVGSSSSVLSSSQSDKSVATGASSAVVSSLVAVKTDSVSQSSGLDTISFSFRAECWLEVSDSRGDVLATELQAAGSTMTLVGKAPFDVKLGNAPAVDIQLNSKKIDVIPLLGSNVLTLRVSN